MSSDTRVDASNASTMSYADDLSARLDDVSNELDPQAAMAAQMNAIQEKIQDIASEVGSGGFLSPLKIQKNMQELNQLSEQLAELQQDSQAAGSDEWIGRMNQQIEALLSQLVVMTATTVDSNDEKDTDQVDEGETKTVDASESASDSSDAAAVQRGALSNEAIVADGSAADDSKDNGSAV